MAVIKYVQHNGESLEIDVAIGKSIMQGAVDNIIEGIVAECGGACACATCHCIVAAEWADKVESASSGEDSMLDAVSERQENSRLSCQIIVTEEMDGLVVHLPESQY